MSRHHLAYDLNTAIMSSKTEYGLYKTPEGYLRGYGTTVPTDGGDGWAPGCLFQHVDGSGEADLWYVNVGTKASCNFDAIDLNIAVAALLSGLTATATEINRVADVSGRIVNATSATLTVTEADHSGKIIVLDRAAGIAVTLPAASAGLEFEFVIKTTFTGAATIKSVTGADIMIGHAIMGNNTDNSIVNWQATAGDTYDTIDMLGTSNSTGGMAGQRIYIKGLAANLWYVEIIGDAAGTEATPFANTVT